MDASRSSSPSGGADGFFFNGPKETRDITAQLIFGEFEYRFSLEVSVAGEMIINEEFSRKSKGRWPPNWLSWQSHNKESNLYTWKSGVNPEGDVPSARSSVCDTISSWVVYHVHDTSSTASMRRDCPARDLP